MQHWSYRIRWITIMLIFALSMETRRLIEEVVSRRFYIVRQFCVYHIASETSYRDFACSSDFRAN